MKLERWRREGDENEVLDVFERGVWCWVCVTRCIKKVIRRRVEE